MRIAIAVSLIVCGTLLILAPGIHSYLLAGQLVDVMSLRPDLSRMSGGEPMSSIYRFVCWFSGCSMVAVAVICSIKFPAPSSQATPAMA